MSLKEGRVKSTKKAELKVAPKKPNILDKHPAKATSKEATPSPPNSPLPGGLSSQRLEELLSEFKSLKNIVVKHEKRIRDLEMQLSGETNKNKIANNGDLLPDEV